jgi:hypothetical protein
VAFDAFGDFAHLGQYSLTQDITGDNIADLVLSSPSFTVPTDFESNGEMGAIYIWNGGKTFPK